MFSFSMRALASFILQKQKQKHLFINTLQVFDISCLIEESFFQGICLLPGGWRKYCMFNPLKNHVF